MNSKPTLEELQEIMEKNSGSLDLGGTDITALPDGLTVGGGIDLGGTDITALPDNLTVGCSLDLQGTAITALPDNLTVGGIDLDGTAIKNKSAAMKKVKRLQNGDYMPGRYLYADGILTHIKAKKKLGEYTFYIGKIARRNVVSDGTRYAHCNKFSEGVEDLRFKAAKKRGAEQYKSLNVDSVVSFEEAKTMYRIITGACRAGTEGFIAEQKQLNESYTICEIIALTDGRYGAETFKNFFEEAK